MKTLARVLLSCLLLLVVACGAGVSTKKQRDTTLSDYGVAVRWNEFEQAWAFVDPEVRKEQPLTDLELERFKQVQITGYDIKRSIGKPDGSIEQSVEIRVVNRNTQIERTVIDRQRWRWDDVANRYWLVSGLPDLTSRQ